MLLPFMSLFLVITRVGKPMEGDPLLSIFFSLTFSRALKNLRVKENCPSFTFVLSKAQSH